jgi:hypothetical protein
MIKGRLEKKLIEGPALLHTRCHHQSPEWTRHTRPTSPSQRLAITSSTILPFINTLNIP